MLALGRPVLAIEGPRALWPAARPGLRAWRNAEAVAPVFEQGASWAAAVVGMSLGGVTTMRHAATRPDLVPRR